MLLALALWAGRARPRAVGRGQATIFVGAPEQLTARVDAFNASRAALS